ncbi:sodium-dependent transporter [Microaceticoccus formicicus]|uniref:sodium-dependent transporter n=1 Tax=Microaceticoccus formicicus TaxID=3118105 RepID=UPI003CCFFAC9|nr:sodium-dependent transporter [Peptoniphilaceae bacterium AMB_02]
MDNTKKFKSKWGFILTAVGSAVGMANVWGFPYKLTTEGGGAFLIAYLFFIIVFGYIGLSAEYAIGRRANTGTLGAYEYAWKSRGMEGAGKIVGWLPLAGSMCIAIGYACIISYVLKALFQAITGSLMTVNPGPWFESFALVNYSVIPYHIIIVVVTLLTCITGADSIEKANKFMMPLFFVLFIILAIRVAFLPNAINGYAFMFKPDWAEIMKPQTLVSAMGQAFFSLSITGSGMIVCGAYLSKKEDIIDGAKKTAIFDTIAAMVAAFVMVPALFSYGLDQARGPGLLFVTLPTILQDMPGGRIFAIILFTAVVFGGVSSLQNMFEVVAESLMHKIPKLTRKVTLVILGVITFGIGVNMEAIVKWGPWMDIVSIYIIPLGATLGAISWFWILKKDELMDEINTSSSKIYGDVWYNLGRYFYTPLAIILCIVALAFKVAF